MEKELLEILPRLIEACPYLGSFAGGAILGKWLKTPATEKEWKTLIKERKDYAKNLEKDNQVKELRLDAFHKAQIEWELDEKNLNLMIKKLNYDINKITAVKTEA